MAVVNPRNRIVFFRVSEEEFRGMEQACSVVGARSISEFARIAAKRLASVNEQDEAVSVRRCMEMIERLVDRLHNALGRMNGLNEAQGNGSPALTDGREHAAAAAEGASARSISEQGKARGN